MSAPRRTARTLRAPGILLWPLLLGAFTLLSGCGSASSHTQAAANPSQTPKSCPATVAEDLSRVVKRVYREGVAGERTLIAQHQIAVSGDLREAVERGDATRAQAAARALVSTGELTNLLVVRGGRTLARVGGAALAPLRGTLLGQRGAPIGSYVTSVWSDTGFLAESASISEGLIALRAYGRSVGGSHALGPGRLPPYGSIVLRGIRYAFASFAATAFPSGPLRIYVLRPVRSVASLCGADSEETTVRTLGHVAALIYAGEAGGRTVPQIHRMQHDAALLAAVARRDPTATRLAIDALLTQHVVRLRVSAGTHLIADVGGPFVLAPVTAPLRIGRRTIGRFVLSIQDDEGYLRLARRLAGLSVLMYMGPAQQLVKNSVGPEPGSAPDSGSYEYRGQRFRVVTLHVEAFPSGPLKIQVLIPIPYS